MFLMKFQKTPWESMVLCIVVMLVFLTGCAATDQKGQADPAQAQQKAAEPEKRLVKAIEIYQKPETTRIQIVSNTKLPYTSVKQSFPLGITVYLPETGIGDDVIMNRKINNNSINSVMTGYADDEKTTAKVEILLKENLGYEVLEEPDGLTVVLNEPKIMTAESTGGEAKDWPPAQPEQADMSSSPVMIPTEPAVMTGIDFTSTEQGSSEIVVKTSHPIRYDVVKGKGTTLYLKLENTDIPDYRQRPLITTYFKSAVERILPVQRSLGNDTSHIEVQLRERVPYRVAQNGSTLTLHFDPSTIAPPEFREAKRSVDSSVEISMAGSSGKVAASGGQVPGDSLGNISNANQKVYTGEKIQLDFYETDIKNIFKILRGVSGRNFAVDKDVTGNVTMTLEKPVPWDQVLDLVLKMNRLGQVQEGSITRIATIESLQQEEKMRQEALDAKKRSLEQEKSLRPLVTEYIPINYSKAEEDIKPHIEKILTPERGLLSVDSRTNMIILTDVQEKIDQAKAMINQLDKVTPQIMIAARIVDVSKDFSKAFGFEWSLSTGGYKDSLGGTYGYDVAVSYPALASSTLGYTFSRITGTPFALDAQLTASETKGDVKVISSPRILTLDNVKATIKQGFEIGYLSGVDDNGNPVTSFKNVDLILQVTPHVTPDDRIAMSIKITKNDVFGYTEDGIPTLSTNDAETELLVNDGNTIVIGGITKSTIGKDREGFPILQDIPGLGFLFRSDTETEQKTELLIFITPTIVQLEQRMN